MAFVDENPNPVAYPNQAPSVVSAGGAGVAGAPTKAKQPAASNVPAQPSAQLSAYLNANQPQAQQMAGNIAGNLSTQVQGAQNAINPAASTYTGNLYTVPTDHATNQQVATSPSQLTSDQKATYHKELGAASNVPNAANTFETTKPYQDVSGQVQNAVQTANLWNAGNNPASLSTAIQPFEGPAATPGDTTLDAMLISQSPKAYGQIHNAVAPAANLQGNLTAATNQADQSLRNAIAQDISTTQAAQAAPQTFATNLTGYLNNKVSQLHGQATAAESHIAADVASGNLTPADLAALGLTAAQGAQLAHPADSLNPGMADLQKQIQAINDQIAYANSQYAYNHYGGLSEGVFDVGVNKLLAQRNPLQLALTADQAAKDSISNLSQPKLSSALNLSGYLKQLPLNSINPANVASKSQYADVQALNDLLGANAPVESINPTTAGEANTAPTNYNTFNANDAVLAAQMLPQQRLEDQVNKQIAYANNQYATNNHFGGMTQQQLSEYLNPLTNRQQDIQATLDSLNAQMT